MTVGVLCLFLIVSCVGLQCVIVIFPGSTHILFLKLSSPGLNSITSASWLAIALLLNSKNILHNNCYFRMHFIM